MEQRRDTAALRGLRYMAAFLSEERVQEIGDDCVSIFAEIALNARCEKLRGTARMKICARRRTAPHDETLAQLDLLERGGGRW